MDSLYFQQTIEPVGQNLRQTIVDSIHVLGKTSNDASNRNSFEEPKR